MYLMTEKNLEEKITFVLYEKKTILIIMNNIKYLLKNILNNQLRTYYFFLNRSKDFIDIHTERLL